MDLPLSKADLTTSTAGDLICQQKSLCRCLGFGQLPRVRLITLAHFHYGRDDALFFLELTLALDVHLLSLLTPLLPELPSVNLVNAHPQPCHAQQKKCSSIF